MEAVNLLPAYARPGPPWASIGKDLSPRRVLTSAGAAAGAVVLLLALGYVYERSAVNHRRATLADVQARAATADAKAAPLRAAQSAVAARIVAAGTISKARIHWEPLLGDISRVLPSQVYLQSLSMQSPTPFANGGTAIVTSTGGSGFSVTGVASSHVKVALVLDRVDSLPWLDNLMLVSSANGTNSGSSGTNGTLASGDTFTLGAGFDPTGGAK